MAEIKTVSTVTLTLEEPEAALVLSALEHYTKTRTSPPEAAIKLRDQLGIALKDPEYY